jgi:hypothetical protein
LKKPVEWMSRSSSPGGEARYASGVGYFANSAGVTLLTIASVDCADRTVDTTISSGVEKLSAHRAPGWALSSRR